MRTSKTSGSAVRAATSRTRKSPRSRSSSVTPSASKRISRATASAILSYTRSSGEGRRGEGHHLVDDLEPDGALPQAPHVLEGVAELAREARRDRLAAEPARAARPEQHERRRAACAGSPSGRAQQPRCRAPPSPRRRLGQLLDLHAPRRTARAAPGSSARARSRAARPRSRPAARASPGAKAQPARAGAREGHELLERAREARLGGRGPAQGGQQVGEERARSSCARPQSGGAGGEADHALAPGGRRQQPRLAPRSGHELDRQRQAPPSTPVGSVIAGMPGEAPRRAEGRDRPSSRARGAAGGRWSGTGARRSAWRPRPSSSRTRRARRPARPGTRARRSRGPARSAP